MEFHKVIICGTDSQRIAVLDTPEKSIDWVAECERVAKTWVQENGYKVAGHPHVSNGNLYVWVEKKKVCPGLTASGQHPGGCPTCKDFDCEVRSNYDASLCPSHSALKFENG